MKKYRLALLPFILLLITTPALSQSNYERGYKAGYTNAFCFDVPADCKVVIPTVKGKGGKFRDGYALGFESALKDRKDMKYKTYNKEYIDVSASMRRQYPIVTDADVFTEVLKKVHYYYLIGDYEKTIILSELLSKNLEHDYRPNMYKGLSLLELEDFKQGKKFLSWAARDVADTGQKSRLEGIIREAEAGTNKKSRRTDIKINTPHNTPNAAPPAITAKPILKTDKNAEGDYIIIDYGTNYFDPNYKSGWDKYKAGDYPGAIADFTKAIAINAPLKAYHLRALAKEKMNDIYGAEKDLAYVARQNAEKNNVGYVEAVQHYGSLLIRLKKYNQALLEMDTLIMKNTMALPIAYYNRGLAKVNLNDKEGGCLDLSRAGELGYQEAYEAIKQFCN